jgi:glutamate racemase
VKDSLQPILDEGADIIVLGCTHYPFLSETISKVAAELYPDRVLKIIDPAPAVARHALEVMEDKNLVSAEGFSMELHASGDDTNLRKLYKTLY